MKIAIECLKKSVLQKLLCRSSECNEHLQFWIWIIQLFCVGLEVFTFFSFFICLWLSFNLSSGFAKIVKQSLLWISMDVILRLELVTSSRCVGGWFFRYPCPYKLLINWVRCVLLKRWYQKRLSCKTSRALAGVQRWCLIKLQFSILHIIWVRWLLGFLNTPGSLW